MKLDLHRGNAAERGYGAQWRKIRIVVLEEEPLCRRQCGRRSRIVDHIVGKRNGGTDDRLNLQGLCTVCNASKTWGELSSVGRGG